ncbi:PcfJ domain-containing protein [Paludisphaera borealis]|uniref:PcfJ domain-containing protein n=1 Tax=Paludisphaera borealis TaxID=1387353 RepID=UPI0009708041|nr:PcfJ domain-containing protein [Paludisphaera borealis]
MRPTSPRKPTAKAAVDQAVRRALGVVAGWDLDASAAFERLVLHVRRRSDLLRPPMAGRRYDPKGCEKILSGLLSLASFHSQWLRPIDSWEPAGENLLPQFSTLARHLLAAYSVPAFLTSVWFDGSTVEARRRQGWFTHIGSGGNIRSADLPLPYTKRMAHMFLQAPDHVSVEKALRWGQVRGLGGSERLAEAVAATRLGRSFESEDFWGTVVRFLVNHPELESAQVDPIIEYLYDQRFVPRTCFDEVGGEGVERPPQPDLSMKGRTAKALWRQVAEWRRDLGVRGRPVLRWPRSGIGEFRLFEPRPGGLDGRVWTIRELLSSRALRAEGGAMRHCVAGYANLCTRRRSTIWSMAVEDHDGRRRVLTIEVDPTTRKVTQARRCCNWGPNPKDREILGLWAKNQGLSVEC